MQEVANSAYVSRIRLPALPCVAPYCVPDGVRVVSNDVENPGADALAFPASLSDPATLSK